jgi:hypothetical protein
MCRAVVSRPIIQYILTYLRMIKRMLVDELEAQVQASHNSILAFDAVDICKYLLVHGCTITCHGQDWLKTWRTKQNIWCHAFLWITREKLCALKRRGHHLKHLRKASLACHTFRSALSKLCSRQLPIPPFHIRFPCSVRECLTVLCLGLRTHMRI